MIDVFGIENGFDSVFLNIYRILRLFW